MKGWLAGWLAGRQADAGAHAGRQTNRPANSPPARRTRDSAACGSTVTDQESVPNKERPGFRGGFGPAAWIGRLGLVSIGPPQARRPPFYVTIRRELLLPKSLHPGALALFKREEAETECNSIFAGLNDHGHQSPGEALQTGGRRRQRRGADIQLDDILFSDLLLANQ